LRAALGLGVVVHCVRLASGDTPGGVVVVVGCGAAAGAMLALGRGDRTAALVAACVLASLFVRDPAHGSAALPFVGWLLLAHALLPAAPYGSLAARGRSDPGGGWGVPRPIFAGSWIVMSIGYFASGLADVIGASGLDGIGRAVPVGPLLEPSPSAAWRLAAWSSLLLELLYAPLAFSRRLRPWIWLAMAARHASLPLLVGSPGASAPPDPGLALLLPHAFTFDPAWVRPSPAGAAPTLFYDGQCGLCHRLVRLVLAEDRRGEGFLLAPLQGETFAAAVPAAQRAGLPDSVVLRTADGRLLTRSAAVRAVLARLGGAWGLLARLARLVPEPLADLAYDRVAAVRLRLFARPADLCPVLPPALRARFRP
jgi:predicted DCC family thiol-disulfide oxidoreductase YuxK